MKASAVIYPRSCLATAAAAACLASRNSRTHDFRGACISVATRPHAAVPPARKFQIESRTPTLLLQSCSHAHACSMRSRWRAAPPPSCNHAFMLATSVHPWTLSPWLAKGGGKKHSTPVRHAFFLFGFVLDRNYNCFLAIWTWEILLSWQSRLKTYCRRPRRLAAVLALADLARQHDRPPLRQWCGARFSSATT